jgi:hypothetical protein
LVGLYAGFGALVAIVARWAVSKVWRLATGEEPLDEEMSGRRLDP